jgi:tetratricopeptide (TPR) repeat protein
MYSIKQADVFTIFQREMGLKDASAVRKLNAEWQDDVLSKLKQVSCYGYEKAGLEARRDKRNLRATRLLKTAIEKGSKNPLVFRALAEIYAEDDKVEEAMGAWKKALEIDPFDEDVYAKMAFCTKRKDRKESERLRALAIELGADDPWVHLGSDDEGEGESPDPGKKKPGEKPGEPPR